MKAVILHDKFDWLFYNTVLKHEGYTLEFNNANTYLKGSAWFREFDALTEPAPDYSGSLIWRAVKYEP